MKLILTFAVVLMSGNAFAGGKSTGPYFVCNANSWNNGTRSYSQCEQGAGHKSIDEAKKAGAAMYKNMKLVVTDNQGNVVAK